MKKILDVLKEHRNVLLVVTFVLICVGLTVIESLVGTFDERPVAADEKLGLSEDEDPGDGGDGGDESGSEGTKGENSDALDAEMGGDAQSALFVAELLLESTFSDGQGHSLEFDDDSIIEFDGDRVAKREFGLLAATHELTQGAEADIERYVIEVSINQKFTTIEVSRGVTSGGVPQSEWVITSTVFEFSGSYQQVDEKGTTEERKW